ncbi:MAG: ABC transporter permease, partial [Lachnospiraceae bacterium]|nr:ABC transporter permease [Lachnospiraceae bacterium]
MKTTTGILPLSSLETRKLKRTGYIPAFLGGGLLAGLVPIVNMTVRTTMFTTQPGNPFHILMDANWQLMAQLNVLLLVCGACILYHTEY